MFRIDPRIDSITQPCKGFALSIHLAMLGAVGASAPIWSMNNPFTLAEAEQAYRSARSVLDRGFDSPRQRHIAWVDGGDLIITREPDFTPMKLVAGSDTGAIIQAASAIDGRSIFFIRTRKDASGTRELMHIDVERGNEPALVAAGAEIPRSRLWFSPTGQTFAFIEGQLLHEFRRNETGRWECRQLLDANDPRHAAATSLSGVVYSPDGMHVAFESWRKAKQKYIAIHDIAKGETRYIDPGIFRDDAAVWSPNGTELAFVREPANWTMLYRFTPQHEGVPWSIVVTDVKTGAMRTVWKADPGSGSVRSAFDPLPLWTRDGQIIFTWEKTGWNLLYAVPAHGGPAKLLTPGEGEVDGISLSVDGRTLAYTTNIGDLSRRHVWSVPVAGGKPMQHTSGKSVEGAARFSAGGYLSYISENRDREAPQVFIRSPKGEIRPLALQPADAVQLHRAIWGQFLPSETIAVRADDGLTSHHVVIKPHTPPPAKGYPVIVSAHGGPTSQTRPGGGYVYTFGQYAAHQGYIFVDINYRGSTGFGLDYRLPDGRGATGGSEVKDLSALIAYLKSRGDVNPKRIGIMGYSYGGHLVSLAMSRLPDDFAAGVSLFGVADWIIEMKKDQENGAEMMQPPEYLRLSERIRIEDLAYQSSPAAHIENWRSPTLLTIGDQDPQGHMESVIDLGYRLLARGVPVEFHVDPAGGHNVFPQERVFEFFERHLN